MRKAFSVSLALIAVSVLVGVYLYPRLPDPMPSHWNAAGEVDGYMPKFWALSIMPGVSILLLGLFAALPGIDPLKRNWPGFRKYYDGMVVLLMGFMFYMHMIMVVTGLGIPFDFMTVFVPAFAVLFYYIGILVENAKQNWFVGIRTPWTLSSKRVWDRTHQKGGKLFKACGVIALVGILGGGYAIWIVIVPVLAVAAYLFVYSYFEYRKEKR